MKGKVGLEPFQRGKVMLNLVPGEECLTRRPDISRGTLFQVVQESRSKLHSRQMLEAGANVEEKKPEHHAEGGSAGLGVHEAQGGRGERVSKDPCLYGLQYFCLLQISTDNRMARGQAGSVRDQGKDKSKFILVQMNLIAQFNVMQHHACQVLTVEPGLI